MKKVLISFHIKHFLPQSANRNYHNIFQDDIKLKINVCYEKTSFKVNDVRYYVFHDKIQLILRRKQINSDQGDMLRF